MSPGELLEASPYTDEGVVNLNGSSVRDQTKHIFVVVVFEKNLNAFTCQTCWWKLSCQATNMAHKSIIIFFNCVDLSK